MFYVACAPELGGAYVADTDALAEVAWVTHADLPDYVPYGLVGPVQDYLDQELPR